ncbi:heme exporter protein CcmD [Rhodanobacter ginsenosidimutans]|uniref:Heme exporter protein D n=1 Tax=Rhodanobacter ginsenosidimutans TaxID=490571 RepID=A0ABW0JQQ3_9GAMM
MSGFLAMGGYAAAVWPAYAVFIVLLAADFLAPIVRRRRQLRELRARLIRRQSRHEGHA